MKFRVDTARSYYDPQTQAEYIQQLKGLGFSFGANNCKEYPEPIIDISTLEELVSFTKEWGGKIVLEVEKDENSIKSILNSILIYDDYIE